MVDDWDAVDLDEIVGKMEKKDVELPKKAKQVEEEDNVVVK